LKRSFCLHSHFYQPPREDPWTNEIEPQSSAAPFHDWNERIFQECYKPNSEAVIVDEHDIVISKINNYEHYSFNFGASLLAWIMKKHPKTYSRIVDADKLSALKHNGHGNAIAMAYNHMIMPLANERDKITQVKWGIEDFKFHFARMPEAMWLPETACDMATVEVLINEGIKFILLDPSQADLVRKSPRAKWHEASSELIPGMPYKCYSTENKNKFINIFFYDGPLSKNLAFDDHIFESYKLLNRIEAVTHHRLADQHLICAALDGETFGHHKKYTERTIAYLYDELLPATDIRPVNFGQYLDEYPASQEVKIKAGPAGEGTSWSCTHGVGRWKENCGCGSGDDHPSQEWRLPLRLGLNELRDNLWDVYEEASSHFFKDPVEARNDYIRVLLDPSFDSASEFLFRNAQRYLSAGESEYCMKLLEMQKFSMFMFTSCGWFFSDISGIESIQNMRYAARAIELAQEISGKDPEPKFLDWLSHARSNKSSVGTGKDIYLKNVLGMESKL
jgi:alpha-amylase/alpha-mannosidase (GH57 family)